MILYRATHFKTGRLNTFKLGRLTCSKSLRDIVNIAKIHRQYSWHVRGWCSDKKEGIFLSVETFEEKNQHQTLYLDPQRAFIVNPNGIFAMVA